MSWLDKFSRKKVSGLFRKSDIPEDLWEKCTNCGQMIFHRDLSLNMRVCTHCGFHMQLPPVERFISLFDDTGYTSIELEEVPTDPLKFRDRKRYTDRLKEARSSESKKSDALDVAYGKLGGHEVVIAAFDFSFLSGSMGMAVGDGLMSAAKIAISKKIKSNISGNENIDDLKDSLKNIKENVTNTFNSLIEIVENTVNDEEVKKDTWNVVNKLRDEISNIVDSTKDKVSDVVNFNDSLKNSEEE